MADKQPGNKEIIGILRKVNIFSEIDDDTLGAIAERLQPVHLKKDETVITKGEQGRTMYIITQGLVRVHDRDHTFTTLTEGQAFGEYSLIDTELRSASVTGAEPTDLLRFDQKDFYQLLSHSADFAKGILKVLIARLRTLDVMQEQLASSNARIKHQKEEIHEINKKLHKINEEKDRILGIVAQDLRDPLTSVISIADSLITEVTDVKPELKEFAEPMLNSLWRINDIVQRILNVRSLEVEKVVLNYSKVDLSGLLESIYQQYKPLANKKGITMEFISEDGLSDLDEGYTRQIFENLVSNAIKFSPPEKSVLIRLFEDDGHLVTEVRDEGPGLSDSDMRKVFGKYQKLSAEPTAGESSIGLGLSIVKKYAEEMDGEVWVESKKNKGARFFVKFRKLDTVA